jgi:transcriptional regulator with XRE-family HTH domain
MTAIPRPARSTIRHGMPSCAKYGCTRAECRRAESRYRAALYADQTRGITARLDAGPATARVRLLQQRGMSVTDIAERAGISRSAVEQLAAGRSARINRTTHDAIHGVPLPPPGHQPAAPGLIDAAHAARLLQELAAAGHPPTRLAGQLGASRSTVTAIRSGNRRRISIRLNQAIRALHCGLLGDQDGEAAA